MNEDLSKDSAAQPGLVQQQGAVVVHHLQAMDLSSGYAGLADL